MEQQLSLFPEWEWTSSQEEAPARTSPSPASAGVCSETPARDPASPSSMPDWLRSFTRGSSSGKTSPAYYPPATDSTSEPSSVHWSNAGTAAPGGFWTLNLPEHNRFRSPSPRDDVVCGLSDVLEPTNPYLLKYFLSSRACEGILRRAAKRGKDLPPLLDTALTEMIAWWKEQDSGIPASDTGSRDARPSEQKAKTDQAGPAMSPSRSRPSEGGDRT